VRTGGPPRSGSSGSARRRPVSSRPAYAQGPSPSRAAALRVVTDRSRVRPGAVVPRSRLRALLVALAVAFVAILGRLTYVQGLSASHYAAIGMSERVHEVTYPAARGAIFDRNGIELAISVPQSTVWADPRLVTAPAQEAQALATVLRTDAASVQDKLTRPGAFSYVARTVDDDTANQVRALNLPGVYLLDEPKRFAPAGTIAAPVVGQVGADNTGLSGLEVQFQKQLSGQAGKLVSEDDPSGKPIPGGLRRLTPAKRGSDLVLTLDRSLQHEVEQDLANQVLTTRARGGMAVVMDTRTGEVLAMSSLAATSDGSGVGPASSNQVLTSVYEPGSVNKLITVSAALQEGVVTPGQTLPVKDAIKVSDGLFRDDSAHPQENWSVTDILAASSNVGTITIAQQLGKDRLDSYLRKFGLGAGTGLHFPGESPGLLLDPATWYGTSIATVPIGQGIAVTAMQLTAAYNAVANGGMYVAPKLVREVVDAQGRTVPTPPSATHRVVSADTAREMAAMLSEVVRTGTGRAAGINGYAIAGKTGTARKAVEGQAGYKDGAYMASFAGFVPAENPAFTAMVVLDEPTPIYGGLAAAPVFAKIAGYALRELQVPPAAPDQALFAGVPHADPSAATAADEPTGAGVPSPAPTAATTQPAAAQPTTATPSAPAAPATGTTPTSPPGAAPGPATPPGGDIPHLTPLPLTSTPAPGPATTTTTLVPTAGTGGPAPPSLPGTPSPPPQGGAAATLAPPKPAPAGTASARR